MPRWWLLTMIGLVAVGLSPSLVENASAQAPARQRVELFDPDGTRRGYLKIDPGTGRLDLFDAAGNRLGWGTLQPDGRVEVFDPRGNRLGSGRVKR